MTRSLSVRRTLALTSALVLTSWGTVALPAAADPGAHGKAGHHQTKKSSGKGGAHASKPKPQKSSHQTSSQQTSSQQKSKPHPSKPEHSSNGSSHGSASHGSSSHASKPGKPAGQGQSKPKGGGKGAPAGNNGTVKIAPLGEMDGIPQNSPHPGCTFQIEWYGFEEGSDIVSTVSFAMHAPTADVGLSVDGPSSVFVGGDPATGAGTPTGLDGQQAYTLHFTGAPHPKQGYHVKLTVSTPRSKGNDTKTKVFWVQPCEDDTTTPGDETTTPGDNDTDDTTGDNDTPGDTTGDTDTDNGSDNGTDNGTDTGDDTTTGDSDTDNGANDSDTDSSSDDQTVTGGTESGAQGGGSVSADDNGAQVPTAVEAGEQNPVVDFVTSPVPLVMIALGALLTVGAFVTRRRARAGR